jgi:hypothetical protein
MSNNAHSGLWRTRMVLCLSAAALTGWAGPAWLQAAPTNPPDQADSILDAKNTVFRWITVSRPAVIVAEAGATERTTVNGKKMDAKSAGQVTPDLPGGWTEPGFDDAMWPRGSIGQMSHLASLNGDSEMRGIASLSPTEALLGVGVLALRGKFKVTDPATTQLKLTLKYRGGVVVYVNGQEVARGSLPEGAVTAATPGLPYAPEAYLDANGKVLTFPSQAKGADKDRIASRDRVLGPVAIPAKALRKGGNVLAIELHRNDYHPSAARFWPKGGQIVLPSWTPCAVMDLRLSAEGGEVTAKTAGE